MRLEIHDPGRRLPAGIRRLLPAGRGLLLVPDHGVPLLGTSLSRLAPFAREGRAACYTPEIPHATDLGLPRLPPLVWWIPAEQIRWLGLKNRIKAWLGRPQRELADVPADLRACRITSADLDERLHYYGRHFAHAVRQPVQVSVVVSNACNLKCVMCPYHSPVLKPTHTTPFFSRPQQMSWGVLDRLASECGELGVPVKIGNIEEPTIHPRLVEFVRACRERGVPSVHITTNGIRLDESMARRLMAAGLTSVYVSIDAARPDTFRRIRGARLEQVEAHVRSLVAVRDELGAACRIMTAFVRNDGVSEEEELEFRDRWLSIVDGVIIYRLASYEHGNARYASLNDQIAARLVTAGRWPCLNPFQEIYVLHDGRVYYCCESVSKLAFEPLVSMGTYPKETLREIWAGEGFRRLRQALIRDELDEFAACRGCGIWYSHMAMSHRSDGLDVTSNMITDIFERPTIAPPAEHG